MQKCSSIMYNKYFFKIGYNALFCKRHGSFGKTGKFKQLFGIAGGFKTYYTYSNRFSIPITTKTPRWTTPEEAVTILKSENIVFFQGGAGTPLQLIQAMTKYGIAANLKNVVVYNLLTAGPASYCSQECEGIFKTKCMFVGDSIRQQVSEGKADFIPIFLSDIPYLFIKKLIEPDIVFIQVSSPDRYGFCTLGTNADYIYSALMHSKYIVAQVNPQMPRTFGDTSIHINHIDVAVPVDQKLPEFPSMEMTNIEKKIGMLITDNLVEDGATIQMGIGDIPDSVWSSLKNHKNLGIHTEMIGSGLLTLLKNGTITNSEKTIHNGQTVGCFAMGNQELYEIMNDNPSFEILRADYTNSSHVIAKNPKMTSINTCIEIDLSGQVVSDSIGTKIYSGCGGQVDFLRGAAEGRDGRGKPIITLQSTTKRGESKIVSMIKPGAGVVTTRAQVHYVVTEYGIAHLFGKTLRQRAHSLISIANPRFQETLQKEAFEILKCIPAP